MALQHGGCVMRLDVWPLLVIDGSSQSIHLGLEGGWRHVRPWEREIIYELTWSSGMTGNLLENDFSLSGTGAKLFTVMTHFTFGHRKKKKQTLSSIKIGFYSS